ncbi:MAG: hypothetical protein ABIF09_04860 [Gemmatimonadota bacterium]
MRAFVLGLGMSWSLLFSSAAQPAQSQTHEGACMEPVVGPIQHRLPRPADLQPPGSSREPPQFFVSPRGDLCQSFAFPDWDEAGRRHAIDRDPEPGKAFLFSAVVPGAGQWLLGQERWPAYLAVELWAWIQFLDWRREGHRLQTQYKDLAWLVARRVSTGPRTEAGWEYYEALTHFQSSGAYDSDPLTPGVQPEGNSTTFNGSVWALAQEIYFPENPENPVQEGSDPYKKAFDYYLSRAYAPGLAWHWGANTLHREEYTGLIRDSDEALRSSTGMIGVILANHLLSAVDALVSGRLGIAGRTEPSVELLLIPGPYDTREVALMVRLPNPLNHDS